MRWILNCIRSAASTQYFLGNGTNDGIRFNSSNGFLVFLNKLTSSTLIYTASKNSIDRLKIERTTQEQFTFYINGSSIGAVTGSGFPASFPITKIGGRTTSGNFKGNLCNVNFNNELKIPLPHLSVGIDNNGDPVKLTNTDVEEDYVKGGSKWLLQHGMMYDRDIYKKDALDPANDANWIKYDRLKVEDGYLKLGYFGVSTNTPFFQNYYKKALDDGDIASKGSVITRFRVVKKTGNIVIRVNGISSSWTEPFLTDGDYYYFRTPNSGIYPHLAFLILGGTGELWVDEIVSYWETVAPNKEDGSPAYDSSSEFDQVINGTSFLNKTPFAIDFSGPNNHEPELLNNGGFDTDTAWTKHNSVIEDGVGKTLSAGSASDYGYFSESVLSQQTKDYIARFSVKKWGGTGFGAGISSTTTNPRIFWTKEGDFVHAFKNNGSVHPQFRLTATSPSWFDDASVKEAPFEILFFDKSNTAIWKDSVRVGAHYDADNTFIWHSSELLQPAIYENIQDAYKYHLWSKLTSNFTQFKDLFFYNTALSDPYEICKTKAYVGIGEKIDTIEDTTFICKTDIITP